MKMEEEFPREFEFAARFAADKGRMRFTRFLDPAQVLCAGQAAREQGVAFSCWGGYEQAERVMGWFYPRDGHVEQEDFPLVCLRSAFPAKFCSLSHRDILGAFMALGLTRACIGDIIIGDEDVFLFVAEQTADWVAQALTAAGKTPLCFRPQEGRAPIPEPRGTRFRSVVSSLRLDAVLAAAYRLSRAEAAQAVHAGLVKVDHRVCERVDKTVQEGTMLSVKGKGRVRLESMEGLTRKQRIGLTFFRYE